MLNTVLLCLKNQGHPLLIKATRLNREDHTISMSVCM